MLFYILLVFPPNKKDVCFRPGSRSEERLTIPAIPENYCVEVSLPDYQAALREPGTLYATKPAGVFDAQRKGSLAPVPLDPCS